MKIDMHCHVKERIPWTVRVSLDEYITLSKNSMAFREW